VQWPELFPESVITFSEERITAGNDAGNLEIAHIEGHCPSVTGGKILRDEFN
jgi:hypothetical protein